MCAPLEKHMSTRNKNKITIFTRNTTGRLNHFFSGSTANLRHAPNKRRSVVRRLATCG
jgi:hypothetical protein